MEAMFCPNGCDCAARLISGVCFEPFCKKCGAKLVQGLLRPADNYPCPKCGASRFQSDDFCGVCGAGKCFLFVFKHSQILFGCYVIADCKEKALSAIANTEFGISGHRRRFSQKYFTLTAMLEVPGLAKKKG